jgi:hypothetical protein
MLYRPAPVFTILFGAAFVAYQAGEHLRYVEPSPGQIIGMVTAGSTVSIGPAVFLNPATFAKIESAPPIVPPNQKFEQT